MTALPAGFAQGDPSSTQGTWQKHQYSFVSMGFTSIYSCDGLADKLKVLLLAAGARPDVKARGGACALGYGQVDKLARADLTFYTLIPDADGKVEGPHAQGQWRAVTLAVRSPRELGIGDCELVSQFAAQVLPMFATRALGNQTSCVPNQNSGSNIDLHFESFATAPTKPVAGSSTRSG